MYDGADEIKYSCCGRTSLSLILGRKVSAFPNPNGHIQRFKDWLAWSRWQQWIIPETCSTPFKARQNNKQKGNICSERLGEFPGSTMFMRRRTRIYEWAKRCVPIKIKPLVGDDVEIGDCWTKKQKGNIEKSPPVEKWTDPPGMNIDWRWLFCSRQKPQPNFNLLGPFSHHDGISGCVPVTICFNKKTVRLEQAIEDNLVVVYKKGYSVKF